MIDHRIAAEQTFFLIPKVNNDEPVVGNRAERDHLIKSGSQRSILTIHSFIGALEIDDHPRIVTRI